MSDLALQSKKQHQFLAAGVAALGAFALGTAAGYTSTAIPSLKASADLGIVDSDAYSWIGSLAPIGACVSGPVAGFLVDRFGRKTGMLVIAPVFVLGWLLIAFAQNLEMIYAGRFLTGLGGGTFSLAVPVYTSEIAEDSIRGTLGSSLQLMINVGVVFTYVVGYFVSWKILALICSAIPVIFFILMLFMPETPRYLLSKRKWSQATESLQWLRSTKNEQLLGKELTTIKQSVEGNTAPSWKAILKPSILTPIGICLALMVFQQWNGNNAIVFYTVEIFQSTGSSIDPRIATIIVGLVQVVASVIAAFLMDRAGRRVLLLISGLLMTVALVILGIFFYLAQANPDTKDVIGWLPLVCLIVFIVAFSLGFGPIAWLLTGELLPPNIKGRASALATSVNWLNTFFVTKVFENIKNTIGIEWCFWIFASAAGIGTVFVFFVVPETKGKSLDEIQLIFKKNKSVDIIKSNPA